MAFLSITGDRNNNQITVACDQYDWSSLKVNGEEKTNFPASITADSPATFEAVYSPGSAASVTQFPLILQDPKDPAKAWVGVVHTADTGNGSCKVSGTITAYENAQVSSNQVGFNANGLNGSMSES